MHGLNSRSQHNDQLAAWIRGAYPGTKTIQIPLFEDAASLFPLQSQVVGLAAYIRGTIFGDPDAFSSGYDFVCHSQGALLCRAVIEFMDDHKVHTFISLAGPQMGVYGERMKQNFIESANLDYFTGMALRAAFNTMVYTPALQSSVSVANMWNDPDRRDAYKEGNDFLPVYNGLRSIDAENGKRKANFIRLAKAVFLVGDFGTGDAFEGTFQPWQSGVFGYRKEGSSNDFIPMEETQEYKKDTFGLKTLNEQGRLIRQAPPGISHVQWTMDYRVVRAYVLPYLGDCSLFPSPPPTTTNPQTAIPETTELPWWKKAWQAASNSSGVPDDAPEASGAKTTSTIWPLMGGALVLAIASIH